MQISRRLVVAGVLLAGAGLSQNGAEFRSHLELVVIPCAVVDSAGSPVRGLTREDFRVFDNDVPRIVSYFSQDDDQPLTLGVLIDDSDSQNDLVDEHRRTVLDLLHKLLRPKDSAFVISVGENVRLYRDLALTEMESFGTPCPKRQGISTCGGSPLWNAVYDAARLKLQGAGNNALLLLTDGFDTGSLRSWREAAVAAQKAGAAVYAIQYRSAFGRGYAPDLYRLVAETAGASFSAPSGDLGPVIARLEIDLRRRYVVGFRPERVTLGKLRHEIRVEVTRPDLSVRGRRVYFDDSPEAR